MSLIQESLRNAPLSNKVVSVLFNEISLNPEMHYNNAADEFKGIVDDGVMPEPIEAKTVLVAMIIWSDIRLKQTIEYWFLGQKGSILQNCLRYDKKN